MTIRKLFQTDKERAVSPVIGVVLMVAITVILAAVIGAFVLGLGDGMGDGSAPNAQLSATVDGEGNLVIEHSGGDSIDAEDLTIRVGEVDVDMSGEEVDTLSVGGEWTFTNNTHFDNGADASAAVTGEEDVVIIHDPSSSILLEGTYDFGPA